MKKQQKTKKHGRVRYDRVLFLVFACTFVMYLCSSIILKSWNISLAAETTRVNNQITTAQAEVDSMTMEIKELTEYANVVETVNGEEMTNTSSTVITMSSNN